MLEESQRGHLREGCSWVFGTVDFRAIGLLLLLVSVTGGMFSEDIMVLYFLGLLIMGWEWVIL